MDDRKNGTGQGTGYGVSSVERGSQDVKWHLKIRIDEEQKHGRYSKNLLGRGCQDGPQ